jgi:hypothetical protein
LDEHACNVQKGNSLKRGPIAKVNCLAIALEWMDANGSNENTKKRGNQTRMSICSCKFLQLLLSVSLVPSSKYQSLLRIRELNFSGYFSRITWNRWAIDASTPMEK